MMIVEIAGHLGADAEERTTPNGKRLISFRVAVRAGKEETVWWRVNVWEEQCKRVVPIMPFLKKGTGVIVVGEMDKPTLFEGKDGNKQISLTIHGSIVRLSPFGKGERTSGSPTGNAYTGGVASLGGVSEAGLESAYMKPEADTEMAYAGDDLPF